MKTIEYVLEIYVPGSRSDQWVKFSAAAPFMAIQPGDILEPRHWGGREFPYQSQVLRVVEARHHIFEEKANPTKIKHLIQVFTEAVPNIAPS
jgi:hypothetical protein